MEIKVTTLDPEFDPDKYILIKTEIFKAFNEPVPKNTHELTRLITKHPEAVIFYQAGSEDEFFVTMLRDVNSHKALIGYARSAVLIGQQKLATAVQALAERSGFLSKFVKRPD